MLLNNHVKQSPIIGLAGMGGGIASYVFLSAAGGYEIARSLRFDGSLAYLTKTFDSAGSRTTWTWSAWIKRQDSGSEDVFTAASGGAGANCGIFFNSGDQLFLNLGDQLNSGSGLAIRTTQVFRDFSAWYHVVAVVDTTNGTQSDRLRLYVNGVRVTNLATTSYPGPSEAGGFINSGEVHNIGRRAENGTQYFGGYLADVWFIDGQALDETSFGEFDATTGVWNPKRYTGTATGNSFHLPFTDTTSTVTLGYDDSGNSNNWDLRNGFAVSSNDYATTFTGSERSGFPWTQAFDGDLNNGSLPDSNLTWTWTPSTSIPFTTLAVYAYKDTSPGDLEINGTSVISQIPNHNGIGPNQRTVITGISSPLTSIKNISLGSLANVVFAALEIDGSILLSADASDIDTLLDSPSNDTDTGTGIGGEIVGNYCTWNPLSKGSNSTLSNGNLNIATTQPSGSNRATIGVSTGKWYWEVSVTTGTDFHTGLATQDASLSQYTGYETYSWGYNGGNGKLYYNGQSAAASTYGDTYGDGDTIGVAFDADNGNLYFYKNGTIQNSGTAAATGLTSGPYFPAFSDGGSGSASSSSAWNFGQRDFAYDAPTGFKALNTAALPTPTIARPDQYVGVTTYTGTGLSNQVVSGLNFQSDLIWIKSRTGNYNHRLFDSVRGFGSGKAIYPDDTVAEGTYSANDGALSVSSTGWTFTTAGARVNDATNYVGWAWKAGGNSNTFNVDGTGYSTASAAGLTAGDITPTGASVNTESGFSIIKWQSIAWTGSAANRQVPHGLGKSPAFIITKGIENAASWYCYHKDLDASNPEDWYITLNNTNARDTLADSWGPNKPDSTTFGDRLLGWTGTQNVIAYLWAEIPGFSKFGSYTGNGSQNFVQLGFRPALVMVKRAVVNSSPDSTANYSSWTIMDFKRLSYNGLTPNHLFANKSINEGYRGNASNTANLTDMTLEPVSNGFYLNGPGTEINANTGTYIYAAWAETPFSTQARAR